MTRCFQARTLCASLSMARPSLAPGSHWRWRRSRVSSAGRTQLVAAHRRTPSSSRHRRRRRRRRRSSARPAQPGRPNQNKSDTSQNTAPARTGRPFRGAGGSRSSRRVHEVPADRSQPWWEVEPTDSVGRHALSCLITQKREIRLDMASELVHQDWSG